MSSSDYTLTVHRTFDTVFHPADHDSPHGKFYAVLVIKWESADGTGYVGAANWGPGMEGGGFARNQIGLLGFHLNAMTAVTEAVKKMDSKRRGGYSDSLGVRTGTHVPTKLETLIISRLDGVASAKPNPTPVPADNARSVATFEATAAKVLDSNDGVEGLDLLEKMRADMEVWKTELVRAEAALALTQETVRARLMG